MRICHVSLSLKTGGLERILSGLASQSDRKEFDMSFVALKEEGRFADEIRNAGFQVVCFGSQSRWQMVKRLKAYFAAERFDIVHTHNTYPHLYGTLAAKLAGVPVVINTRHGQRAGHGFKSQILFRLASRWVDRIVAVSDDAAKLCSKPDGIPKSKIVRIWNGIDTGCFDYAGSSGKPLAVTVARLVPEKDIATLIRATAIACNTEPELRLRIIGDGPMRADLEMLATELRISERVDFYGECKDVPRLLASCGFFVSSSVSEGISLSILEAMAIGLPIVATQAGGTPEIVVEPQTGFLVPVRDPAKLAEAMVKMCQLRTTWDAMGLAGRNRVIQFFDVRTMAANYHSLYREVSLKKQSAPLNGLSSS